MTSKQKILVVDDEVEFIRKPLVRQLNRIFEDFEILEAGNGKEAIEIIAEHHPELVILDLMMPVMNGIDTLHELLNQGLLERTRIVVYTAASDEGIKLQALRMGAIDYLEKTVQLEELEIRIRNFLALQPTEGSQHTIEEPLNEKEEGLSLTEIISNVNSDDVQDDAHVEYDESNHSENTSGKPIGEMNEKTDYHFGSKTKNKEQKQLNRDPDLITKRTRKLSSAIKKRSMSIRFNWKIFAFLILIGGITGSVFLYLNKTDVDPSAITSALTSIYMNGSLADMPGGDSWIFEDVSFTKTWAFRDSDTLEYFINIATNNANISKAFKAHSKMSQFRLAKRACPEISKELLSALGEKDNIWIHLKTPTETIVKSVCPIK